jgi:predicted nucleotidyltransferase component of viral defense system
VVFHSAFKPIPIGIKVEINKETADFEQNVAMLKSPFNNLEVLGRVYTLESIFSDKQMILETQARRQPRDLFDAWYIAQKLDTPWTIKPEYKYSKKELMDGLNYLLPTNQSKVMELFCQ